GVQAMLRGEHPLRRDNGSRAFETAVRGRVVPIDLRAPWCAAHRTAADDEWLRCCRDRKSTRLNSSHLVISYAVFCLKKKTEGLLVAAGASACIEGARAAGSREAVVIRDATATLTIEISRLSPPASVLTTDDRIGRCS